MWVEDVTHRADLARALAEARDQLRDSERLQTLATLAGGLAHDLNNILTPIIGYADLAREAIEPGSRAIEDIDLVKAAATRAADLVSRLMLLSRAERDDVVPVSVQDVVREVLSLLAVPGGRQVEIVQRADVSCRPILGTKSQIHRVLFNLCKNAVHAMPDGGTLTVSVESPEVLALWESTPDGATPPFVRVRVEDTGVGMDDRTLERIFEPLFTTRGEGKGSGLGLAMVKSIVGQYGGSISVRSRPGQGTTFSLVFAGYEVASREPAPRPSVERPPPTREVAGRAFHVLVCDDDESVLNVLARSLEKLGYSVTAHSSGEAALEAFQAAPDDFDLLLTDQVMPGMTGLDLVTRIRDVRHELPVVVTTGLVAAATREDLARLRCDLLPKPATTSQLREAVERGLRTSAD
jgi:nitrogen-specific signal transduction histidine kinase/ActR/RegA family two-component response regulator